MKSLIGILLLASCSFGADAVTSPFRMPNHTSDPSGCVRGDTYLNMLTSTVRVCLASSVWSNSYSATTAVLGRNVVAKYDNSLNTTGFIIQDFSGTSLWSLKYSTSSLLTLTDEVNSRNIFQSTAGSSSSFEVPQGLIIGNQSYGYEVSGESCGLVMDGSTDNSTALSACGNRTTLANGTGITVVLSPGVLGLGSPVVFTKDNVHIRGAGGGTGTFPSANATHPYSSTVIRAISGSWNGSTSSMLTWDGSGTAQGFLTGPGLSDVDLDANSLASRGVTMYYAAGGLFHNIRIYNWTSSAAYGDYGIYIYGSTTNVAGKICGNNGGDSTFDNVVLISDKTGAGGVRLGNVASQAASPNPNDVCSIRFTNLNIIQNARPGLHGLFIEQSDSDQFTNVAVQGTGGEVAVASISGLTATTARISAPGHGLPPGATDIGINIQTTCTVPLTGSTCGGSDVPGLDGALRGTYVDSSHIDVTGAYGLTATTYYAYQVTGTDVEFGKYQSGDIINGLLTCHGIHSRFTGGQSNSITNWNWQECNNANSNYAHIAGAQMFSMGFDGTVSGQMTFRGGLLPASTIKFVGTMPNNTAAIDLTNAPAVTPASGYIGLYLRNNTSVIGRNAANSGDIPIFQTDASDNVLLGNLFGVGNDMHFQVPSGKYLVIDSQMKVTSIPTSCSGKPTGTLWNDSGTVKICP